jgi:hypothetical protein
VSQYTEGDFYEFVASSLRNTLLYYRDVNQRVNAVTIQVRGDHHPEMVQTHGELCAAGDRSLRRLSEAMAAAEYLLRLPAAERLVSEETLCDLRETYQAIKGGLI